MRRVYDYWVLGLLWLRSDRGLGCCALVYLLFGLGLTSSLHCSSFLGVPFKILNIELVKPKKGTTMETIGRA